MTCCGYRAVRATLAAILLVLAMLAQSRCCFADIELIWQHPAAAGQQVNAYIGSLGGIYVQDSERGIFHYDSAGKLLWQYPDLIWNIRQLVYEFPGVSVFMDPGGHCWGIDDKGELAWEYLPRPWDYQDYQPGSAAPAADFYEIAGDLDYGINAAGELCWILPHADYYTGYCEMQIGSSQSAPFPRLLRTTDYRFATVDRQGVVTEFPGMDGIRFPRQASLLADGKLVFHGEQGEITVLAPDYTLLTHFDAEPEEYRQCYFHSFAYPGALSGWAGSTGGKIARLYDNQLQLQWSIEEDRYAIRGIEQLDSAVVALVQKQPEDFSISDNAQEELEASGRLPPGDNASDVAYTTWLLAYVDGQAILSEQIFPWSMFDNYYLLAAGGNRCIVWEFNSGVWCYEVQLP